MLLIKTKRNQPKVEILLKANGEIKTKQKTNGNKTSFDAGALCN